MANTIRGTYKSAVLTAGANTSLNVDDATNGPFCMLHDVGADPFNAADDFYDDIVAGIVGTDQRITAPTVAAATGIFDGADLLYVAVSGATVEALSIYRKNAGANTTWRLVAFIDTGQTGLPVTPNGGDIAVAWHASGIFGI